MSALKESRRVLIVEDEAEIISVYKDILSRKSEGPQATALKSSRAKPSAEAPKSSSNETENFEVTAAGSGEEALEAVKIAVRENKPFAMGFFDVLLGDGIDGIETVKRIHSLDQNMYAVLVTAYQDRHVDSIKAVFGKEFQDRWDYLNKPFSEGEILQKARSMVSMWNIRRRELGQRASLEDLRRKLGENEKMLTVAAVARSVGHEFGNILLQIMGRADLSRNGSEAEMRNALDNILNATEHASKVLDRFKRLAKPHQSHDRVKLALKDPINETVTLMDHELQRRHIEISLELGDLPFIKGNRTALIQVFMNLIINAMHAVKEKGRIEIRGKQVGHEVVITLRDTGSGIPETHWETVFEPFFTTKGDEGTGLGLPICKEIVEITHDGKISVSNHPQGGAEFTMVFPSIEGGEDGEGV